MKKVILLKDKQVDHLIVTPYDLKDLYQMWLKENPRRSKKEVKVMKYILNNYMDIYFTYRNNNNSGYTLDEFNEEISLYMRDMKLKEEW